MIFRIPSVFLLFYHIRVHYHQFHVSEHQRQACFNRTSHETLDYSKQYCSGHKINMELHTESA